jgi:hypothetical protein
MIEALCALQIALQKPNAAYGYRPVTNSKPSFHHEFVNQINQMPKTIFWQTAKALFES